MTVTVTEGECDGKGESDGGGDGKDTGLISALVIYESL